MIEIPPTDSTNGFSSSVFFERTDKIRDRIVDCTREELIDLAFFQLQMLEEVQGASEALNFKLEKHLGYYEDLRIKGRN